jgi:hypothetical protein
MQATGRAGRGVCHSLFGLGSTMQRATTQRATQQADIITPV